MLKYFIRAAISSLAAWLLILIADAAEEDKAQTQDITIGDLRDNDIITIPTNAASVVAVEGLRGMVNTVNETATQAKISSSGANAAAQQAIQTTLAVKDLAESAKTIATNANDRVSQHEQSVNSVIAGINKNITSVSNNVNTVSGTVTTLSGKVDTLEDDVASIDSDVIGLHSTVGGINSTVRTQATTITNLANAVSAWTHYWGGDDFVVTVTNYPTAQGANRSPSGKLPLLSMDWKTQDANSNEYFQTVWNQKWYDDYLKDEYLPTNYYSKAQVDLIASAKADRAWGKHDSETGEEQPEGVVSISSPNIMIANGYTFKKFLGTSGSLWVITDNNGATNIGATTNATFAVSDFDGTPLFEIVKGDKRIVGCAPNSLETDDAVTPTKFIITYNVTTTDGNHPKVKVKKHLITDTSWHDEADEDCPATATWSGANGAWTVSLQYKSTVPSAQWKEMYALGYVELGGDKYIKNHVAVEIPKIRIGGTEYTVTTATISGKTVLILE